MALSAKKLQEVMKEKRRRDKLPPRPVIAEPIPLTLKPRELRQVSDRCSHVLLAIESTLVQCARELSLVDDEIARQGLACLIRQTQTESEGVAFVISRLEDTRQASNVDEHDWVMALRAICTSVLNYCNRKAGSMSYLTYARAFVARANGLRV